MSWTPDESREGPIETLRRRVAAGYAAMMARRWAEPAITLGVILYAVSAVVGVLLVATSTPAGATGDPTSFATFAQVVSTIAGAALVALGVVRLPTSRIAAYHWFMRGLLVWILLHARCSSSTARSWPGSAAWRST